MTVIANSFGHIRLSRIADQLHETQGSSHIEVQADGGDELTHMHGSTVLQCKTFLGSRKYGSTVEVLLNWIQSLRRSVSSYSVSLVQPVLPVVGVYRSPLALRCSNSRSFWERPLTSMRLCCMHCQHSP
jgi:hypothetical protein